MTNSPSRQYVGEVLLDRYYVDRIVGKGAFAWVYHGRTRSGDEVAVKVLFHKAPQVQARFDREVKVLKSLAPSPNIVAFVDSGVTKDGVPLLVTEYVDGRTLKDVLKDGPRVTPEKAARFLAELCQALAPLHALGVVHRDVKPSNVLLGWDGSIKLIDFGLVRDAQGILRLLEDEVEVGDIRAFAHEIDTGVLAGTIPYMAPEQFADAYLKDMSAARTDTYTDVFTLGVILYELLCGRRPFEVPIEPDGGPDASYLRAVKKRLDLRDADIAPLEGVDPALESIVRKALSSEPERRQADARALWSELVGYLERGIGATRPEDQPTVRFEALDDEEASLPSKPSRRGARRFVNASTDLLEAAAKRTGTWPGLGAAAHDEDLPAMSESEELTVPDSRRTSVGAGPTIHDAPTVDKSRGGPGEGFQDDETTPEGQRRSALRSVRSSARPAASERPGEEEATGKWSPKGGRRRGS